MDLSTILGIGGAFVMLIWAILFPGTPLSIFIDIPSIVIVIGGCLCATMASFPMNKFLSLFKLVIKAFTAKLPNAAAEIERIAEFATVARKEGLLALEEKLQTVKDPFLVKGLRLVVDGFPPETVRDILGTDLSGMQERHGWGKAVLDKMAETGPAFGMLGTLIGLVQMLNNLSDPSQIGAGMAVALLTTLYGAIVANVVFIPLATKLDQRKKEETMVREIMIEGIAGIQAGDKPQVVKEKLKAYLSPKVRASLEGDKAAK